MAVFECVEGVQGQGKSLDASRLVRRLLQRNKKFYERQFNKDGTLKEGLTLRPKRQIACNIEFSDAFQAELGDYYLYWQDVRELCKLRHCDIIWDEIANDLDARNFAMLSNEVKRFLSRARKRGLDIYANTQDFDMIDKRARTMMKHVYRMRKLIGSPDPSATKPEIRRVWGLFWKREFLNFKDATAVQDFGKRKYSWFPAGVFFLHKEDIDMYDTTEDHVSGEYPPLEHAERVCERHGDGCDFKKTFHN